MVILEKSFKRMMAKHRDDENFAHAAVWEYKGDEAPRQTLKDLKYENVKLAVRSYK